MKMKLRNERKDRYVGNLNWTWLGLHNGKKVYACEEIWAQEAHYGMYKSKGVMSRLPWRKEKG